LATISRSSGRLKIIGRGVLQVDGEIEGDVRAPR
jgi:hypothetical protein